MEHAQVASTSGSTDEQLFVSFWKALIGASRLRSLDIIFIEYEHHGRNVEKEVNVYVMLFCEHAVVNHKPFFCKVITDCAVVACNVCGNYLVQPLPNQCEGGMCRACR